MRPITVYVGPGAVSFPAYSQWVRFDDWGESQVSIQTDVTGTVNYTLQQTLDDPNSPTDPVPVGSVNWVNSPDATMVGATAGLQSNYSFKPTFARIMLNSGSGSVSACFTQAGGGDY